MRQGSGPMWALESFPFQTEGCEVGALRWSFHGEGRDRRDGVRCEIWKNPPVRKYLHQPPCRPGLRWLSGKSHSWYSVMVVTLAFLGERPHPGDLSPPHRVRSPDTAGKGPCWWLPLQLPTGVGGSGKARRTLVPHFMNVHFVNVCLSGLFPKSQHAWEAVLITTAGCYRCGRLKTLK